MPPRAHLHLAGPILLAGLTLLATVACAPPGPPPEAELADGSGATAATVARVIDGDTVDLRLGSTTERVRLLGIDTPETVDPDEPVQCFGPEASARTKELLSPGTPVAVRRDREARDRYGRLLLYVWRVADGAFVNRVLVEGGFAEPLAIAPNVAHRAELAAAARTARAAGVGRWGTCPSDDGQR